MAPNRASDAPSDDVAARNRAVFSAAADHFDDEPGATQAAIQ